MNNPLENKKVMLALDIDDIKMKCKELGYKIPKDIDIIDSIFYDTRKGIESGAMDVFWIALESAIEDNCELRKNAK